MNAQAGRQSHTFLALYALAWAGGTIAYVPLLTLLLPARVGALAGEDAIGWLASLTFIGALAASAGNILVGWLSDLSGVRRPWIAGGLIGTVAASLALGQATTFVGIATCLVVWQLALNGLLGPLSAWAGDAVPDVQKGTLGGLLAFAPAAGSLAGAVTWHFWSTPQARLAALAVIVSACVLPLLLAGRPRTVAVGADNRAPGAKRAAARMWLARLLVQISEAALFAFFFLWFSGLSVAHGDAEAARLIAIVLCVTAPIALLAGKFADRLGRPILPLRVGAVLAAAGLIVMAVAGTPAVGIGGYVLFGIATNVFLALHSAQTLRVLPRADRRGRDLGIFNLTNTVPSLIMPWLTIALVPSHGFAPLFLALAVLAVFAALLLRAPLSKS